LAQLEVYTFASAADDMPSVRQADGSSVPFCEHFAAEHDVVARLGCLTFSGSLPWGGECNRGDGGGGGSDGGSGSWPSVGDAPDVAPSAGGGRPALNGVPGAPPARRNGDAGGRVDEASGAPTPAVPPGWHGVVHVLQAGPAGAAGATDFQGHLLKEHLLPAMAYGALGRESAFVSKYWVGGVRGGK